MELHGSMTFSYVLTDNLKQKKSIKLIVRAEI